MKEPIKQPISRREFARRCALGAAALASGSILFDTPSAAAAAAKGPARFVYPLDQDWLFGGQFASQTDDKSFAKVTVPHCAVPLSWEKSGTPWPGKNSGFTAATLPSPGNSKAGVSLSISMPL